MTNFARATVTKDHKPQESLPDTTLGLLESRRVDVYSNSYSRASKF